ncbi:hypothetical protein [Acidovorax sp.]|uniref:hypothetical protein n=1 Tax=Acidovorax sp. TaxID=1872122 RepID=UPI00391C9A1F
MLTFAPPSAAPSAVGWIGALAAPVAAWLARSSRQRAAAAAVRSHPVDQTPGERAAVVPSVSHDEQGCSAAADGGTGAAHTYWPCDKLNAFILRMAAHGQCVNADMMLGHRPYARERLAAAGQMDDDGLRELAQQLQHFFDAPPEEAVQTLDDVLH